MPVSAIFVQRIHAQLADAVLAQWPGSSEEPPPTRDHMITVYEEVSIENCIRCLRRVRGHS